ncbi:hypothetical protein [Nocardioides sp. GXQ0305]|uniref:hypothetical protein n=1 Tax=Nocardioides sp. GXQ0305 TaxID=3423912 RepID=UPI003D7D0EB4
MTEESTPRPSHTTIAAGMVIAGSVMVVVTVGEQIAGINSLETRRSVEEFLATSPGTGLDAPQALLLLRTALMVVAGCATAAAILGYHVLKRNRSARLGLTFLAVPLFFGGLATGGFLTSLVAASALLLWVGPSRAWLDRTPLPERTSPFAQPRETPTWPPPPPVPPRDDVPPPHTGTFGAPQPPPPPPPPTPERRPVALVWACALTWGFCGLAAALMAASLTLLAADPSLVWVEIERQNPGLLADSQLARDDLLRSLYVVLGVFITWAVLAMVLGVLAYRRNRAGRIGLVVSAGAAGGLCLVASFGSGLLLVPALACVATVMLLARADVRAWFAARPPLP